MDYYITCTSNAEDQCVSHGKIKSKICAFICDLEYFQQHSHVKYA